MRSRLIGTLLIALLLAPTNGAAAAAGLEGSWSGSGYVVPKEGAKENVRCRVRYVKHTEKVYRVSATCASASVKIIQTGELLEVSNGRYVGDFYNPQFDVSGRVRVLMSGSRQTVTFSGGQGRGALSLSRN